uniref:Uncharacterized protein n=1 Tax=Arundo donax TaxID=35708 RepID=A0A0A8Y5J1_ARUDO
MLAFLASLQRNPCMEVISAFLVSYSIRQARPTNEHSTSRIHKACISLLRP